MSAPNHSGAHWVALFPGSNKLEDLEQAFQDGCRGFIAACRAAGAAVDIAATWRPSERAYLMHYCCLVAGYRDKQQVFHQIAPPDVPPMTGVEIDWTCGGDAGAARAAAVAMVKAYGIAYPAALVSNHTRRKAIDMKVRWKGIIKIRTKRGVYMPVDSQHPEQLWPVGASYGVIKLPSDPPHWSHDGR